MEFYREQLSSMLDSKVISDFQKKYQGSDEERSDLLEAYEKHEGDLDLVYQSVMLSNVLDDDARFRAIIDQAIASGEVASYKAYSEESEKSRQRRKKQAQREAKEAEKHGRELEAKKKKASKASGGPPGGEDDLLAIISKRQQQRGQGFLAQLEEKYAPGHGKKRGPPDEPSEEAFAAVNARKKSKAKPKKASK